MSGYLRVSNLERTIRTILVFSYQHNMGARRFECVNAVAANLQWEHQAQILEVREIVDNLIKQELATRSSGFFEQRLSVARLANADASSQVIEWHRAPADCVASFDQSNWSEWFSFQHGGIDGGLIS